MAGPSTDGTLRIFAQVNCQLLQRERHGAGALAYSVVAGRAIVLARAVKVLNVQARVAHVGKRAARRFAVLVTKSIKNADV
jgi:hypothetical protein